MASRKYPQSDVKILYVLAAARCSCPGCQVICSVKATEEDSAKALGIIAHIYGHSDDGPRPNLDMSKEKRDCYNNWVLLCSHHHDQVDNSIIHIQQRI